MKECDIFRGSKILWPLLHIFRRSRPPTPGSTPLFMRGRWQCAVQKVQKHTRLLHTRQFLTAIFQEIPG